MEETAWPLQEAKDKFSHLVEKARKDGPQLVTTHGRETVVILSFEDYQKMKPAQGDLVDFFRRSPLVESTGEITLVRQKDKPRDFEL